MCVLLISLNIILKEVKSRKNLTFWPSTKKEEVISEEEEENIIINKIKAFIVIFFW